MQEELFILQTPAFSVAAPVFVPTKATDAKKSTWTPMPDAVALPVRHGEADESKDWRQGGRSSGPRRAPRKPQSASSGRKKDREAADVTEWTNPKFAGGPGQQGPPFDPAMGLFIDN